MCTKKCAKYIFFKLAHFLGVHAKMLPVAVAKKAKKDRKFHSSNWLFAQTTHTNFSWCWQRKKSENW